MYLLGTKNVKGNLEKEMLTTNQNPYHDQLLMM